MRINSETGFVKWVKAFYVKNVTDSQIIPSFTISEDQVMWAVIITTATPYVYRISDNGTLLQTIIFGSKFLNFSPIVATLGVLNDSEFLYIQDMSILNGNTVNPFVITPLMKCEKFWSLMLLRRFLFFSSEINKYCILTKILFGNSYIF